MKNKLKYLLLLLVFITLGVFKPFTVAIIDGNSMNPTLKNGNLRISNNIRKAKVGDVVIFHPIEDWDKKDRLYIKRMVAGPGDHISVENNIIYINGKRYINIKDYFNEGLIDIEFDIKDGYCFLAGDNIGYSKDSLYFFIKSNFRKNFLVPTKNIQGVFKEESMRGDVYDYVKSYYE